MKATINVIASALWFSWFIAIVFIGVEPSLFLTGSTFFLLSMLHLAIAFED